MVEFSEEKEKASRVQWTDVEAGERPRPFLQRTNSNLSINSVHSRRGSIDPASALPISYRTVSFQIAESKEKNVADVQKAKDNAAKGVFPSVTLLSDSLLNLIRTRKSRLAYNLSSRVAHSTLYFFNPRTLCRTGETTIGRPRKEHTFCSSHTPDQTDTRVLLQRIWWNFARWCYIGLRFLETAWAASLSCQLSSRNRSPCRVLYSGLF